MKPINTLPIEDFLEKARIAIKSNQKTISFTLKEVTDLQNSLSIVMTRLAGEVSQTQQPDVIQIKMDGGRF
jgi:hypothetical protein